MLPSQKSVIEKRHSQLYQVLRNSLAIQDENILVISDAGNGQNTLAPLLGHGYYSAAQKKSHDTTLLYQGVKKGFMSADQQVITALRRLDKGNIIVLAVSNKLGRFGEENSFRSFCRKRQHRFISATGLGDVHSQHLDLFMKAMHVNYPKMKRRGMAIKKCWDRAEEIRVKTAAGTDLRVDVSGMEAIANIGEYHEPGSGGNMPAGEVYIPPRGIAGAQGQVVIDGTLKTATGALLLQSPITLQIKDGIVTDVAGKQASLLTKTFERFEDRAKYPGRIRSLGEIAIGINPGAQLIGSTIIDEKVLGTGHIAIGSNNWFGGAIKTIYHGDQVFKRPIFYVDGKKMRI